MMPPRFRRVTKIKKETLHYALEVCDRSQLITVISSKGDLDRQAGLEVLNIIKKSRDINKISLTPLQGAISVGNINICRHLIAEGAMLESNSKNPHPLCLALQKGHFDIAHFLIEAGADVNTPFEEKLPIIFALENVNCPIGIIEDIIQAGFPLNGVVNLNNGKTILHSAVEENHVGIVEFLLKLHVNPNLTDQRGMTALHYAVQKNFMGSVKMLIDAGAQIDIECSEHLTPMFSAIATGNYDMVKVLLRLGADIHYVNGNKDPMTPLHFAVNVCKLKITQLLLEMGADVNREVPLTLEIPLHSAAKANTEEREENKISLNCIVELLIKEKSNLEARQKLGMTPLQLCIVSKNFSVAKILIKNCADLNSMYKEPDDRMVSSFHLIAKTFDKELIKLSLEYGANFMLKDSDNNYPWQSALLIIVIDFITSSRTYQCLRQQSTMHKYYAGNSDLLSVIKLYWKYGFPFDLTTDLKIFRPDVSLIPPKVSLAEQKQRMLFNGIQTQNLKMVQRAIAQGAEVRCCSYDIRTPLHFIVARGDDGILKEFLKRGYPVNIVNDYGHTPLHVAARQGHPNCCRLLLEHGACYNHASPKTPLCLAKERNHSEVVALLTIVDKHFKRVKKGHLKLKPSVRMFCSVMNCHHRDGNTLLGRAIQMGFTDIASRLMKRRLQVVQSKM